MYANDHSFSYLYVDVCIDNTCTHKYKGCGCRSSFSVLSVSDRNYEHARISDLKLDQRDLLIWLILLAMGNGDDKDLKRFISRRVQL